MSKFFYDTEFLEDGRTIDLISIGILNVKNDGSRHEYYAVNLNADWGRIRKHEWLMRNVVPKLPLHVSNSIVDVLRFPQISNGVFLDVNDPTVKSRFTIADEVKDFLLQDGPDPELWTWYGAYDHVRLMQLWGSMMDRPDGIPMFSLDLRQECHRLGVSDDSLPQQETGLHNALSDAYYNAEIYDCLLRVEAGFPSRRVVARCSSCSAKAVSRGDGRPVILSHAPDCPDK